MGETIVAGSSEEAKMGKTGAANPTLEVSVSFGRFENDSLSWEKWSSFSPNKYLEEVEKCATPGSVAMKKAYFEAHYKKIAARKAELQQDQAQQMGEDYARSVVRSGGELMSKTSITDTESDESVSQTSADAVNYNPKREDEDREGPPVNQDSTGGEVEVGHRVEDKAVLSDVKEVASLNREVTLSLGFEDTEESLEDLKEVNKPEDSNPVDKVEALSLGHQDTKELPKKPVRKVEKMSSLKKDTPKSGHPKVSQKAVVMSKVREVARPKVKPSSPATKVPQISTPKVSKPVPASAAWSASQSSTKKIASSSLPRNKTPPASWNKQAVVKSLHMSINLGSPSSASAPPTTARSSLIMEKMKDKDIIKRAFKTFQSSLSQSSDSRTSVAKQTPSKGAEATTSTTVASRKENGGAQTLAGMEKRNAKVAPSYSGTERDERPERKREPLYFGTPKKLEEKSISRKSKSAKTKERQEAEIKKIRQSFNFKATPMPAFYRSSKVAKNPLHKEGLKTFGL